MGRIPPERSTAMAYRKTKGTDTWHFCKNCSNWPKANYESSTKPTSGELCNECRGKERNGNCEK
jgi:hypothetical protein